MSNLLKTTNINHKKIIILSLTIFSLLVLLILTLLFISIYPFKPIEFKTSCIDKKIVRGGDIVTISVGYKKYVDKIGHTTTYLVNVDNDESIILSLSLADASVNETIKKVKREIPKYTLPGKYKLRLIIFYDYFGGFRKIYVNFESPIFEVVR